MIRSVEKTAKTEEEAIREALADLGKTREEVTVEVLEKAKSGFLGIHSAPAVVRVSYEYIPSKEEQLKSFLDGLFERMEVTADMDIRREEDGSIHVDLTGEDVGTLIGRRGETLDALQHLCNYAVNHGGESRVRINIDAENYRAKRAEALEHLARKVAQKVLRYRRSMTLEPMNAYERHIIHTALQDYDSITTFSTGTEPNRRVVVAYDRQKRGNSEYSGSSDREWNEDQGGNEE